MKCRFEEPEAAPLIIIEDTRQQIGKHDNIHDWMQAHGVQLRRTKML